MITPTRKSVDLVNMLKVMFDGPLYNSVVTDSEFLSYVQTDGNVKVNTTTGGRYIEKSNLVRLGGGVGSRSELDYIPEARRPMAVNPRINLRKIQGTAEISGDALRLAKGSEEAFVDWATRELPNVEERLRSVLDRQYIGTGNGIIAKVASKGADFITVTAPFGVTGYSNPWVLFMEGDSLVFTSDAAGTTVRAGATHRSVVVDNIDESTNTLFLKHPDGTSAVAADLLTAITVGDFIFLGDEAGISAPKAGENREIEGALAIVDDGGIVPTYHNITRANVRQFKGNVMNAAGAALTEDLLVNADQIVSQRGGGRISHLIMSFEASVGYWKDLKGDRRLLNPRGSYTEGKGDLGVVLGDRTLSFNIARKLPPELCFGLQLDTWVRYTPGTGEWDDATGDIFNRATDGTGRLDQFYAVHNMYENLHCDFPRKNVRIENLDPTP